MRIDVARLPEKTTLVKWEGSNEQEMREVLTEASGESGWFTLDVHEDSTCTVSSPAGTFEFAVGDYMYTLLYQWGSPLVARYTPEEVDATFYLYPATPPVTSA